jgi:hypothetical protein
MDAPLTGSPVFAETDSGRRVPNPLDLKGTHAMKNTTTRIMFTALLVTLVTGCAATSGNNVASGSAPWPVDTPEGALEYEPNRSIPAPNDGIAAAQPVFPSSAIE